MRPRANCNVTVQVGNKRYILLAFADDCCSRRVAVCGTWPVIRTLHTGDKHVHFAALWSRANPSAAGWVRDRRRSGRPRTVPHPGGRRGLARTMTCPNVPAGAQAEPRGPPCARSVVSCSTFWAPAVGTCAF